MNTFKERVRSVVSRIPKGKVMSYGEVATAAGNPRAARAVGAIMHVNDNIKLVPCHRVVCTDGSFGGYNSGLPMKKKRLRSEGVRWDTNGKIHAVHRITAHGRTKRI